MHVSKNMPAAVLACHGSSGYISSMLPRLATLSLSLALAACGPQAADLATTADPATTSATAPDTGVPTSDGGTDPDTDAPTSDGGTATTGDDPGSTDGGDTGSATDTDVASVLCPRPDWHIEVDQDGLPDTVLNTQDEVALLAGCTDISGSLQIGDAVADLTPLASLRRITGSLYVNKWGLSAKLTSLQGLEGLESVRSVELNHLLVPNLDPLAGLTDLPGGLRIERLTQIESLAGLHNLKHIGGPLRILQADKLSDLQALAGLTEILDSVELTLIPALTSLEGLHNLERVGNLRIDDCPLLADLDGLRGLQRVDEDISLERLSLTHLHGLEVLTELGEPDGEASRISLVNLPQLASLDALAVDWHGANALAIHGTAIADLAVLAGVTELADLSLADNDALVDLAGLEALVEVHDTLSLSGAGLVDLGALANLESVGWLMLEDSVVTDLALPSLQEAGNVFVRHNAQLTALSGLAGLSSVGRLTLEGNPTLNDLSALAALTQVEHDLEIRSNDALSSVADLAALTGVGGRLVVVINQSLLQTEAVAWGATIGVGDDRKIARNKGDLAPPADPCPWEGDWECDEKDDICAMGTDESDCQGGG
jgi:hypothetical protein